MMETLEGRTVTEILVDPKIINTVQIQLMEMSPLSELEWVQEYSPRVREIISNSEFTEIGNLVRDIDAMDSSQVEELGHLYDELVTKIQDELDQVER